MITVQPPASAPAALPLPAALRNIAEYAESQLRRSSYLALKNLCCKYQDGILTLRGCVSSYYLKQVAQTAVAHIEGVRRVVNEIVVTPSPSACRSARR